MRDIKKAKTLKLEITGTKDDLYIMEYILTDVLAYQQTTGRKLNYSLQIRDNEGVYEALGTDDTEFILQLVESIKERRIKCTENEEEN